MSDRAIIGRSQGDHFARVIGRS